jgi:hypothetical protein
MYVKFLALLSRINICFSINNLHLTGSLQAPAAAVLPSYMLPGLALATLAETLAAHARVQTGALHTPFFAARRRERPLWQQDARTHPTTCLIVRRSGFSPARRAVALLSRLHLTGCAGAYVRHQARTGLRPGCRSAAGLGYGRRPVRFPRFPKKLQYQPATG